ncbi:MAG TPA: hypothetical protein PLA50_07395 [Bacteroidia bacterium]|nr:hypothetical protein [Bacteroidia bacterium]
MRHALLLLGLLLSVGAPLGAADWTYRNGDPIPGAPVRFDSGSKLLTFRDELVGKETLVPSKELSLKSRQRLLLSPIVRDMDRTGEPETVRLFLIGGATAAATFFAGFLIAAWLVCGKRNPFQAAVGFAGAWIVVAVLAACYSALHSHFGGNPRIVLLGAAMCLALAPFYLSAVYNCGYLKGQLLFFTHLLVGTCLFLTTLAVAHLAMPEDWWDREVFAPVGIIAPEPRTGP